MGTEFWQKTQFLVLLETIRLLLSQFLAFATQSGSDCLVFGHFELLRRHPDWILV